MIRRILEVLLPVLLAVGIYQAWTTGAERSRLQSEYDRLVEATGELPIGDPTKVHIRALPSGEPLSFAWRVYLPVGFKLVLRSSTGSTETTSRATPQQFIVRTRFRVEDGVCKAYERTWDGALRADIGDETVQKFLDGRWDRLLVEQLGSEKIETLDSDRSAFMLRLTLPDEMLAEAGGSLRPEVVTALKAGLYSLEIGPNRPVPTAPASPTGK